MYYSWIIGVHNMHIAAPQRQTPTRRALCGVSWRLAVVIEVSTMDLGVPVSPQFSAHKDRFWINKGRRKAISYLAFILLVNISNLSIQFRTFYIVIPLSIRLGIRQIHC